MTADAFVVGRGRRATSPRRAAVQATKVVLSLALTAALTVGGLPLVSGVAWPAIAGALSTVSVIAVLALTALWLASIWAHTLVFTASLPGLTKRRAMLLTLTGSSVSNLMPFGGAFGTALNYSMTRTWGHSRAAFVLFAVMTHLWGVAAKLALPILALVVLLATGSSSGRLLVPAVIALVAMAVLATVLGLILAREGFAASCGRLVERVVLSTTMLVRRPRQVGLETAALDLRRQAIAMLRLGWRRPVVGMVAYFGLQGFLLWACLHLVGAAISPAHVLAVYALERLLSVLVVTPGGLGVVEVGMTALLVAFGGNPAAAAAGVVLFRAFTFAAEIPVGGTLLVGWLGLRMAATRTALRAPRNLQPHPTMSIGSP
ncbi:MAG: putative heme transporter [Pseudonocardiales bacterium]|nr:putative heme transporter [Pseudonocardiales bacterium]